MQKLILPPRVALLRAHCRLAAAVPVELVVLVELEVFQDLRQVMVVKELEHLQFLGYLQQLLVYHLMANLQVVVVVPYMVPPVLPPLMRLV